MDRSTAVERSNTRLSKQDIRERYDDLAPRFDRLERLPEMLGVRRVREDLLRRARGHILEVAAGTGRNAPHYPEDSRCTLTDLSAEMLRQARETPIPRGHGHHLIQADTEALPFATDVFDTVVDTLTLCTYPEPLEALREMARVCRPDGEILLLEHGRSDQTLLGWLQDRLADRHYQHAGCRWNRERLALVEQSGLRVRRSGRSLFGVLHRIEARPVKFPKTDRSEAG